MITRVDLDEDRGRKFREGMEFLEIFHLIRVIDHHSDAPLAHFEGNLGQPTNLRGNQWDAVEHIDGAIFSFQLLEKRDQSFYFQRCRRDEAGIETLVRYLQLGDFGGLESLIGGSSPGIENGSHLVRLHMCPKPHVESFDGVNHILAVSSDDGCVKHNGWLRHVGDVLADIEIPQLLLRCHCVVMKFEVLGRMGELNVGLS